MIENAPRGDWRALQDRAAGILRECGLEAEVAKTISVARGSVEVDVYATDPMATPRVVYICECKLWRKSVPQGEVHAFRTVMSDAGAHVGLFLSAEGFQKGAFDVIKHTNIHLLDWDGFQKLFLERWCDRFWVPTFRNRGNPLASYVDPVGSDASRREALGESIEPAEAIGLFVSDMWGSPFNSSLQVMMGVPGAPLAPAIWACRERYRKYLPRKAADAESLRELLDAMLAFVDSWVTIRRPSAD